MNGFWNPCLAQLLLPPPPSPPPPPPSKLSRVANSSHRPGYLSRYKTAILIKASSVIFIIFCIQLFPWCAAIPTGFNYFPTQREQRKAWLKSVFKRWDLEDQNALLFHSSNKLKPFSLQNETVLQTFSSDIFIPCGFFNGQPTWCIEPEICSFNAEECKTVEGFTDQAPCCLGVAKRRREIQAEKCMKEVENSGGTNYSTKKLHTTLGLLEKLAYKKYGVSQTEIDNRNLDAMEKISINEDELSVCSPFLYQGDIVLQEFQMDQVVEDAIAYANADLKQKKVGDVFTETETTLVNNLLLSGKTECKMCQPPYPPCHSFNPCEAPAEQNDSVSKQNEHNNWQIPVTSSSVLQTTVTEKHLHNVMEFLGTIDCKICQPPYPPCIYSFNPCKNLEQNNSLPVNQPNWRIPSVISKAVEDCKICQPPYPPCTSYNPCTGKKLPFFSPAPIATTKLNTANTNLIKTNISENLNVQFSLHPAAVSHGQRPHVDCNLCKAPYPPCNYFNPCTLEKEPLKSQADLKLPYIREIAILHPAEKVPEEDRPHTGCSVCRSPYPPCIYFNPCTARKRRDVLTDRSSVLKKNYEGTPASRTPHSKRPYINCRACRFPNPPCIKFNPCDPHWKQMDSNTKEKGITRETLIEHLSNQLIMKRAKRQTQGSLKWDLPIRYRTDKSVNGGLVKAAIKRWEDATCLKFEQMTLGIRRLRGNYLNFIKGDGCHSLVGKNEKGEGQEISIGNGCDNIGSVSHEIGHALGLWHEHSRKDRDKFITVKSENIPSQYLSQFMIQQFKKGVHYDYGSIMHYSAKAYAKDAKKFSLEVNHFKNTIGQRSELSFFDAKLINRNYCNDICKEVKVSCKNGGYPNPHECAKCSCPTGLAGDCTKPDPTDDKCDKAILEASNNWKTLKQSGKKSCNFVIRSSGTLKIELSEFKFKCEKVCQSYVEIKYLKNLAPTGARFCCNRGKVELNSEGSTVLVLYRSNSEGHKMTIRYKS